MKKEFQSSSRKRLTVGFAAAANIALAAVIWYAVNQDIESSNTVETDTDSIETPETPAPDLETVTPVEPTPATITLTNGYGLRFEDRNTLFGMHEDIINHAYYDAEYDRYHEKTDELHTAFLALEHLTPLPYEAYEAAAWKETRLQPNQINESSGAAGYFQFKMDTFCEAIYFMGERFPEMTEITSLIAREGATSQNNYTISYNPANEEAREHLQDLMHDPLISGMAYYSYLDHYMQNFVLERVPDLEPNQTDYYLISFRGPGGASDFLQALAETPDAPAHDMFINDSHPEGHTHPFVTQNSSVYYDSEREAYRTYQEVYDYIADDMGMGRTRVGLNTAAESLASLVRLASQETGSVIPADSLIFAENLPRPVLRPEGLSNDTSAPAISLRPLERPDTLDSPPNQLADNFTPDN